MEPRREQSGAGDIQLTRSERRAERTRTAEERESRSLTGTLPKLLLTQASPTVSSTEPLKQTDKGPADGLCGFWS